MASETTEAAAGAAQDAARSPALRKMAAAGLVGYAVLHLLVGWLVLQLAWGGSSGGQGRSADQSGALNTIASSSVGSVLLWGLAVGLAGLCVWQAVEFLRHHRHLPGRRERWPALFQLVKTVGTAVFYGYLAVSASRTALGDGQHQSQERRTVRGVLSWPGGQLLVIGLACVVAGIGIYLAQKGIRSDFLDQIDLSTVTPGLRTLTYRFSQAGFVLKGLALVMVAVVVGWAAATFDPARATGLDGALRAVIAEPFGPAVLTTVAAGMVAFAVFCLARARHPVG